MSVTCGAAPATAGSASAASARHPASDPNSDRCQWPRPRGRRRSVSRTIDVVWVADPLAWVSLGSEPLSYLLACHSCNKRGPGKSRSRPTDACSARCVHLLLSWVAGPLAQPARAATTLSWSTPSPLYTGTLPAGTPTAIACPCRPCVSSWTTRATCSSAMIQDRAGPAGRLRPSTRSRTERGVVRVHDTVRRGRRRGPGVRQRDPWGRREHLAAQGNRCDQSLNGVSCPSAALCVAVDATGKVLVSSDPGAASPSWAGAPIDSGHALSAVSCASSTLCVAVDDAGNVLASANPSNRVRGTPARSTRPPRCPPSLAPPRRVRGRRWRRQRAGKQRSHSLTAHLELDRDRPSWRSRGRLLSGQRTVYDRGQSGWLVRERSPRSRRAHVGEFQRRVRCPTSRGRLRARCFLRRDRRGRSHPERRHHNSSPRSSAVGWRGGSAERLDRGYPGGRRTASMPNRCRRRSPGHIQLCVVARRIPDPLSQHFQLQGWLRRRHPSSSMPGDRHERGGERQRPQRIRGNPHTGSARRCRRDHGRCRTSHTGT